MKIKSHHTYGFEKEEVEVITTNNVEVVIEREGDCCRILTLWSVYTTYRNDEFYEEDIVFIKSSVLETGEQTSRVFITREESQEIKKYISSLEI